jgi:hypothetical protein
MAIVNLDGIIGAAKQKIPYTKTASRTTTSTAWYSLWDLAGQPSAGNLATVGGTNTAGVVPTDATTGAPNINAFGGGAKGYLSIVDFSSNVAGRLQIVDRLFNAGAYSFNSNVTLSAQPSYSARVPGGTDFGGLEIWFECITAFTGNPTLTVTYTNQAGTTGRSTGAVAFGFAPTLGRMLQLPLQAGDSGVQKIESVVCSVATVGTFNILVLRPLWSGRVQVANAADVHGLDRVGMPEIYTDSCLQLIVNVDGTTSGIPDLLLDVING